MSCRICGENNPDEANFCGNCGKTLRSSLRPSLRPSPLTSRPKAKPKGLRLVIVLLFFLSLAAYISYLIVEVKAFDSGRGGQSFREKTNFFKERSKDKNIEFSIPLTSQEIDGYLNEELLKKVRAGFTAIHTSFTPQEIEIDIAGNFSYIPTVLRLKVRPVEEGEDIKFVTSGMSLGRLPIPSFLYPLLYRFYPGLNLNYWLNRSGLKLKEVKLEKDLIFLRGVWPL